MPQSIPSPADDPLDLPPAPPRPSEREWTHDRPRAKRRASVALVASIERELAADRRYRALKANVRHMLKTALAERANADGEWWWNRERWAEAAGVSIRTLSRAITTLSRSGLLIVKRHVEDGRQTANNYQLDPAVTARATAASHAGVRARFRRANLSRLPPGQNGPGDPFAGDPGPKGNQEEEDVREPETPPSIASVVVGVGGSLVVGVPTPPSSAAPPRPAADIRAEYADDGPVRPAHVADGYELPEVVAVWARGVGGPGRDAVLRAVEWQPWDVAAAYERLHAAIHGKGRVRSPAGALIALAMRPGGLDGEWEAQRAREAVEQAKQAQRDAERVERAAVRQAELDRQTRLVTCSACRGRGGMSHPDPRKAVWVTCPTCKGACRVDPDA